MYARQIYTAIPKMAVRCHNPVALWMTGKCQHKSAYRQPNWSSSAEPPQVAFKQAGCVRPVETVMGETRVDAVDQARTIIYGCLERDVFTAHDRLVANVRVRREPSRDDDSWSARSVALLVLCGLLNLAVIAWSLGCATAVCR